MTSKQIVRSAEDIDEKALSYAEIKALSSGNPLIVEKIELDAQVSKLKLLKQSHLSQIYRLEDLIVKFYPVEIKNLQNKIINIQEDIEIVKKNTQKENEEKFSPMTLKGKIYTKKENAGNEILEMCKSKENKEQEEIGEYRGLKMFLEINSSSSQFELTLKGHTSYKVSLGTDIYGNITRIDNVIDDMEKQLEKTKIELENMEKQFETAKIDVKISFDKEDELKEKMQKLNNINNLLNLNEKDTEILEEVENEDKNCDISKNHNNNKDPVR